MLDADLRQRVRRLARGDRRVEDLDRIYLGLRDRSRGHPTVREIGDFVAHRRERDKGALTGRVRDIFVSLESWAKMQFGEVPTIAAARKTAESNLRIATNAQLKARLGLRRPVVRSALEEGLRKLELGVDATPREQRVVNYLAGAFIWNQHFSDADALRELGDALVGSKLLEPSDRAGLSNSGFFLSLYILTLMHGAAIRLENGGEAHLIAGCSNDERRLEIKAQLVIESLPKPVIAPVCVFWTSLVADEWCEPQLLSLGTVWTEPLEIAPEGKLRLLS